MWERVDKELKSVLYTFFAAILSFPLSGIGLLNLTYNFSGERTTIGSGTVFGIALLTVALVINVSYKSGKKTFAH